MDKRTSEACAISAKQKFQGFTEEELTHLLEQHNTILDQAAMTGADPRRAMRDFLAQQSILIKQSKLQKLDSLKKWNDSISVKLESSSDKMLAIKEMLGMEIPKASSTSAPLYNIKHRYEEELVAAFGRVESKYPEIMSKMSNNDLDLKVGIGKYIEGRADHGLDEAGLELANTIKKMNGRLYNYKVDAGFNVSYKENYAGKVYHPSGKDMEGIGLERFKDSAKKNWVLEGDAQEIETFLERFYFDRVNDPNKSFWKIEDDIQAVTRLSPGRRFEKSSKIQFKDLESQMKYQHEMGQHYFANLLKDYSSSAGELAGAEVFGANAKANFLKSLEVMRQDYVDSGKIDKFDRDARVLKDNFEMATKGKFYKPADNMAGRLVEKLNKITDMAKLGPQSYLSTLPDWAMAPGVYSSVTGENFFESSAKIMPKYFKNFSSKQLGSDVANRIGFLADSYLLDTVSERGQEAAGKNGFLDKAHHYMMKTTGLHRNDIAMKRAGAEVLSQNLAESMDRGFDNLHPPLKKQLEAFGFNSEKFSNLDKAVFEHEGSKLLSVETLRDADFKLFPGDSAQAKRKYQNDLVNSLYSYVDGMTSAQVPNQSLGLKTFLGQFDPNTPQGMAMRLFFKFKTYPLSVLRSYKYIYNTGGGKYGNVKGLAYTGVSALALATISDMARTYATSGDIEKSTTFNADRVQRIFIRSGVSGLYGDLLLEDRNFAENLVGPTVTTVGGGIHLMQQGLNEAKGKQVRSKNGFRSNLTKEGYDYAAQNMPGAPYLRLAPIKAVYENMKELMGEL